MVSRVSAQILLYVAEYANPDIESLAFQANTKTICYYSLEEKLWEMVVIDIS